jgi:hypothetical protein
LLPKKEVCAECHRSGGGSQARADCIECHRYHPSQSHGKSVERAGLQAPNK